MSTRTVEVSRLWGMADGWFTGKDPVFPDNSEYMKAFTEARARKERSG